MPSPAVLTLAHSPDPDDAFMWWPITGKIDPSWSLDGASDLPRVVEPPAIGTGRFDFRAIPADIDVLNRAATGAIAPTRDGPLSLAPFDVTAISFRAYAACADRYRLTACGSSFGDAFGPKVVVRPDHPAFAAGAHGGAGAPPRDALVDRLRDPRLTIAIPGVTTTAFLVLAMAMDLGPHADRARFRAMPFDRVIPAVARGEADAGLVIHEGQVTYEHAGLALALDIGAWWHAATGLPLPLGANAVRRDLDARFGPGTTVEVSRLLSASIRHALDHRREALAYTMPFALANTRRSGEAAGEPASIERVDRYVAMYVNRWTIDMGDDGLAAVRRLFIEGARRGLCDDPGPIDLAR